MSEIPNPIRLEFGAHGHWLRHIWRDGDIALYERSRTKEKPPHELEMVVIRIRPERLIFGKLTVAHEAYPTDEEWGHYGWSFPVGIKERVLLLCADVRRLESGVRPSYIRKGWIKRGQPVVAPQL
jgi:hypothetical protein